MPAYNFKQWLVLPILEGRKPHTIRRRRKRRTKVGDTIMMFIGLRTKHCLRFGEAPCVKVEPVVIYPFQHLIKVNGHVLGTMKALQLAKKDGFDDLASFFEFFQGYGQDVLDDFEIIYWDPKQVKNLAGF